MYITLKSIKRNLGLFNLEFNDIIVGSIFGLTFTIIFLLHFYTISFVLSLGIISLVPVDFSKCNRIYKLFILFTRFIIKNKKYYFYK